MEQLNRVELRGTVGSVRIQTVAQGRVANFTLVTNYVYKDHNGGAVIEATWHNVTAWEGVNIPSVDLVEKGGKLYVVGRLKGRKYNDSAGIEHNVTEIQASRLVKVEGNDTFQPEMQ